MESFKNIREKKEGKLNLLNENPDLKKIINNHIMLQEGISDNALVSLIVYVNGNSLNEDFVDEIKLFNYLDEDNKLTEEGKKFIESEEIINRLKEMVS